MSTSRRIPKSLPVVGTISAGHTTPTTPTRTTAMSDDEPSASPPKAPTPVQTCTWPNSAERTRLAVRKFLDAHESFDEMALVEHLDREFLAIRIEQEHFQQQDDVAYGTTVGADREHQFVRNRYRDILPYDSNRVKLSLRSSSPSQSIITPFGTKSPTDYINASHIFHAVCPTRYIASQGPLASTVDDFWQMVWEQDVRVIAMLCKFVENGAVKCERYWADDEQAALADTRRFGQNLAYSAPGDAEDEEKARDGEYVVRKIALRRRAAASTDGPGEGPPTRLIHQLQFLEWPDHGIPNGERAVIDYIEEMNRLNSSHRSSPILVHCSAGVGRTGTIIALDVFRKLLADEKLDEINVKQLVLELRKQRVSMVQTASQYLFLNKAIATCCREALKRPTTNSQGSIPSTTHSPANDCKCEVNGNKGGEEGLIVDLEPGPEAEDENAESASACASEVSVEEDDEIIHL